MKQVSKAVLLECSSKFVGILDVAYTEPFDKLRSMSQHKDNFDINDKITITCKVGNDNIVYRDIICVFVDTEAEVKPELERNVQFLIGEHGHFPYRYTSSKNVRYADNKLYRNELLSESESPIVLNTSAVLEITEGFTDSTFGKQNSQFRCDFGARLSESNNPGIGITFNLPMFHTRINAIITKFANVLVLPFLIDISGKRVKDVPSFPPENIPYLACFSGNRNLDSGLETVFVYFDHDQCNTYGVCINTAIAKFKHYQYFDLLHDRYFQVIRDKNETYTFLSALLRTGTTRAEDVFMSSYRTRQPQAVVSAEKFVRFHIHEKTESFVPVKGLKTALLCSLNKGLYHAKHETEQEALTIDKLTFSSIGMNTEVVHTLKINDINFPVNKLRPLTMVEDTKEDIVVVCAVEDKNNMFVMIWLYKSGNQAVELLEIGGYPPELSDYSAIDLEMDENGNLMFVLQNGDGRTYPGITKYMMP